MTIGPLRLMVVGFVDPAADGSILGALEDAEARRHRNDRIHRGHDRDHQCLDESDAIHNDGIKDTSWLCLLV